MGTQKSTNERVFFLGWLVGWFVGLVVPVQKIFIMSWLLYSIVGPVKKNFFLTIHYFNSLSPISLQAGQAAVLIHLSPSIVVLHYIGLHKTLHTQLLKSGVKDSVDRDLCVGGGGVKNEVIIGVNRHHSARSLKLKSCEC